MDVKELNDQVSTKYEQKDFQGALLDVERLIQLEPNNANHFMSRGAIKEKLGNNDGAIFDFKQGIELEPNGEGLRERLALFYSDRQDWQNAANVYSDILKKNPKDIGALLNRGNSFREINNMQAAVADYSEVIKLDPNEPAGYQSRALTLAAMGQLDKAKEDMERAGRIQFPNDELNAFTQKSIGNFYKKYNLLDDAKRHWKTALDLYHRSANSSVKNRQIEILQKAIGETR